MMLTGTSVPAPIIKRASVESVANRTPVRTTAALFIVAVWLCSNLVNRRKVNRRRSPRWWPCVEPLGSYIGLIRSGDADPRMHA